MQENIDHDRCVSEEELESRLNASMFAHSAATYESLVEDLLAKSGQLFARGRDDLAAYLRDTLVPEYRRRAVDLRKKQKEVRTDP